MTQAEELNLELELIFDNSPTFDNLGSGMIQKKDLIFHLESGAFLCISRFFIPGMYA